MSCARQILPGSTYLLTRRCSERRYFLRPDPFVERVFGYLLAVAADMYDVDVHGVIVMSNHYHAVVTDRQGRLPEFMAWLHLQAAKVVNAHRGRWESLWNSSKPSAVRLETADDMLDKLVYVMSNAVAATLVPRASDWPGLASSPEDMLDEEGVRYERPDVYFDAGGRVPTSAHLRITRPPGFEDMGDEQFVAMLRRRLDANEETLRSQHVHDGRRFLGAQRVRRISWQAAPSTRAPRRRRDPQIAARDDGVRTQAIERMQVFRASYREALQRWRNGQRDVRFPAGTYAMRVRFHVHCHDPPAQALSPACG